MAKGIKQDYKKIAIGNNAFKKAFPNGIIIKSKLAGKRKPANLEELTDFHNLFLDILSKDGAKKYLALIQKYPGAVSKQQEDFAKRVFKVILKQKPSNDLYSLSNMGLQDIKIEEGFWMGQDYELLTFLCEKTRLKSSTIEKVIESAGFEYSLRRIQQEIKDRRKKPKAKS